MHDEWRDRIWRAVTTAEPGWLAEDIARVSDAPLTDVLEYCAFLETAGYVRRFGGERRFRTSLAAQDRLTAPTRDGTERVTLEVLLTDDEPGYRLLGESRSGAFEEVAKRCGKRPPAFFGRMTRKKITQRDHIWKVIREMREFKTKDLIDPENGIGPSGVRSYIDLLRRNGFLSKEQAPGQPATFRLIHDPGSQRPPTPEVPR